MRSPHVMVISEHSGTQKLLTGALERCGCPIVASTVQEASAIVESQPIAFILCSDESPDNWLEDFVQRVSRPPYRIPVVIVSRFDDWKRYVRFLQAGAFDYLLYPANGDGIGRVARVLLHGRETGKPAHAAAAA